MRLSLVPTPFFNLVSLFFCLHSIKGFLHFETIFGAVIGDFTMNGAKLGLPLLLTTTSAPTLTFVGSTFSVIMLLTFTFSRNIHQILILLRVVMIHLMRVL